MLTILALMRLRQEDQEFKASLDWVKQTNKNEELNKLMFEGTNEHGILLGNL
jgi:hypothetical protein